MHVTIRRYDGIDPSRTVELTDKVNETLVPKLSKMEGFKGYYLRAGRRVDEGRLHVGPRREARDGVPQRSEDLERQGRRPQERLDERLGTPVEA